MARKNQGRSSSRGRKQSGNLLSKTSISEVGQNIRGYDYKNLLNRITGNQMVMNAGIGAGAFFLVKYAIRYYKSHPAIGEFIKENLDTVETKFGEYRSSQANRGEEDASEARH